MLAPVERKYLDRDSDVFEFVGVIHCKDGYYYCMHRSPGLCMLSCLADNEDYDFTLLPEV